MQTLHQARPTRSIIVEEAPSSRRASQTHMPIDRSDGFYTCGSGGLGYGIAAAVGIALAKPDDKVIGLIGDGSSMYAIQALWTAGQLRLPVTFVIVRNGRYRAAAATQARPRSRRRCANCTKSSVSRLGRMPCWACSTIIRRAPAISSRRS